jgi:hypothetical protein
MVAKTLKPGPKISEIFLHFAGDSTMTRFIRLLYDCVKWNLCWHFLFGISEWRSQGGLRLWCVYYTMGKAKFEAIIKQTNRFAVLAEPDSDDDLPAYAPLSPTFGSQPSTEFYEIKAEEGLGEKEGQGEPGELGEKEGLGEPEDENVIDSSGVTHFRVWKNDVTRFSSDTNNIFSSPFSRKRTVKKEEDGWTSIESGPLATGTSASSQDFPSMLSRGDVADALAWADKVKTSLDKARHRKMSFFRRTVVLDEKF